MSPPVRADAKADLTAWTYQAIDIPIDLQILDNGKSFFEKKFRIFRKH
jgi:hypothetical protein